MVGYWGCCLSGVMTEVFFRPFANMYIRKKYSVLFAFFKNFIVKYCIKVFGTKRIKTIV